MEWQLTDNESIYHHLLSLRAHGWIRDLPENNKIYKKKGNRFEDSFVLFYQDTILDQMKLMVV